MHPIVDELLRRLSELSARDVAVFAGLSVCVAIAWIGRNVSRLLDALEALRERVRDLESCQPRLQKTVRQQGKQLLAVRQHLGMGPDWRDDELRTEQRDSGVTVIDLSCGRKP